MKINLRVSLKIPDAEAATVKNTLRRRMGYGAVLEDLRRERLWSIEVDDSVLDPESLARRLARELVNENKESYKATVDSIDFEEGYVPVKVGLRIEDGEAISAQKRLRNRLGFDMVRSVERSSIWKLSLRADDPERTAGEIAERLLINPHKDFYEIMR
ncbi:MAG: putative Phosphoribosylformylglycinamidine synthase [Methanothrix sp.]|jgi:phosphoribosylformylglycinamidine (FGAM) synthase PurS component|nr:MAG: putative Phosphoribosylformylglycinamidine synthase [Methanothrix sp.]